MHHLTLDLPSEALLYQTILDQNFTLHEMNEAMYKSNPVVFEGDWSLPLEDAIDPKGIVHHYLGPDAEIITSHYEELGPIESDEVVSGKCRVFL
jgi:hypothetical protein